MFIGKKHTILTRSKTGSLQPRTFNMDDLKRRSAAGLSKAELDKLQGDKKDKEIDKDGVDSTRITRLKAQQIATGIIIVYCPVQMNVAVQFISSCPNKEKVVRGYHSSSVEDTSLLGC
jgi:hypothetical protein